MFCLSDSLAPPLDESVWWDLRSMLAYDETVLNGNFVQLRTLGLDVSSERSRKAGTDNKVALS